MAKKRTFETTNPNNYERRSTKKRDTLIFHVPFMNNPDEYPIDKEILDIIENTPFNKIQFPLYCSRAITEDGGSSTRYVTVGNVLTYDKENKQFKVIIHKQFKEIIEERLKACEDGELVATVQYSTYNDKLSVITKICIDIVDYATADEEYYEEELDGDDCSPEEE